MKPLKMLLAAALALCAALAGAAESDPPAVVGRLNYINGPVSFAPAQANEDWVAAALNRPVTTGDRLWTDPNGRAELHVGSLAIRMASQTSMDVLNLDDRTLQLRVAQGAVNLRVRRLSSDKMLEIATPGGAVVVQQPGSYRVSVDPSGAATVVAVRHGGAAEVYTGNSTFTVRDNQETELSGARQGVYAAAAPDDFDRWAAERDRREDSVASTRYVGEEMTGYEDLDQYGGWHSEPQYGAVWVPRAVPAGWAPYRYGHWVWISPWGWTWVDDAPWGFAPFHYGRWVWLGNHWAWAPGRRVVQPVYAPALVAFIGGSNFSVSVGIGSSPAVGWVPLGWHEPYRPWYRASHAHVRNVNVTNVTNVTNITNVTNVRLVNRTAPSAVTVVSRENFVGARRTRQAALNVPARQIAAAPVTQGAPVAAPARTSLAAAHPGSRPPAQVAAREAVAVNVPAPAREQIREAREERRADRHAGDDERPRVRVIDRQAHVNPSVNETTRAAPVTAQGEAPRASAPAQAPQPDRAERVQQPANQDASRPQAARRAPGPPAETSARPTFDRDMRARTAREPQAADAPRRQEREERQAERRERTEPAQQQELQRQAQERQVREQQTRQQEERQRAEQRTQQEQQRQRHAAQEQQAREQQARQQEARQRAEQQRGQQEQQRQAQERQRQQAEQQAARQAREQQARAREAQQRDMERQLVQQQQEMQRRQMRERQARAREHPPVQRPEQQREARETPQRGPASHEKGRERERGRAEKAEKG